MYDAFSRMEILMGTRAVNRLGSAKIAVFLTISTKFSENSDSITAQ